MQIERRAPPQFLAHTGGIDGIATVMSRSIRDEGDEIGVRAIRAVGHELVHPAADCPHHVDVRHLRVRPDVVDLARLSLANDQLQGACVIFDMEPVTHILAVAVDGDGPSLQSGEDGDRDQLLRHLVGTIVVGTMADHDRQPERAPPGPGEVVRGRLARRVR